MPKRATRRELASARLEVPATGYARTKGRNGWFVPRAFEVIVHRHKDGTPLVTIRQYSRRSPARAGAPSEYTLPLLTYRWFAAEVDRALDHALTNDAAPHK
jgi:hypothetical protein